MPKGLPAVVRNHLTKARDSAISAVEIYNKPAIAFRSGNYVVLMTIAFTSLFHAIFYRQRRKPWYKLPSGKNIRTRYKRIDGDPAHWELAECLRQYYGSQTTPERENLNFIVGLRNKIEHRSMPHLDPALFGECQALLMNFEDLLVKEFGEKYALNESLAMALQFSRQSPKAQQEAQKRIARGKGKEVLDYIQQFRAALPSDTLNDQRFRFSVYLVPKPANHEKSADFAIEFVHFDSTKPAEMEHLTKLTALIKERHVPVMNLDLNKAGTIITLVEQQLTFEFKQHHHVACWKYFGVRPSHGEGDPSTTIAKYCVYDKAHSDYLYTAAWVKHLVTHLSSSEGFRKITGRDGKLRLKSSSSGEANARFSGSPAPESAVA